jgi:site-specific DNA-cytosine methylase
MGAARKLQVADLFCGAGGTSTGVALACRELDVAVELLAINHWQTAIATHTKNHPWARHMCANVEAVDPHLALDGARGEAHQRPEEGQCLAGPRMVREAPRPERADRERA